MLRTIAHFLHSYGYLFQPLFFVMAWLLVALFVSTLFNALTDVVKRSQTMHQIPCHSCRYFTNDYHLKCTVNPTIASTESAIDCQDFQQV